MRRFEMHLPATVRVAGQGLRDLSPHVTLTEPVRVRFTARVVRLETSPDYSGIGVAAMIEEYEFLRSAHNPAANDSDQDRFGT